MMGVLPSIFESQDSAPNIKQSVFGDEHEKQLHPPCVLGDSDTRDIEHGPNSCAVHPRSSLVYLTSVSEHSTAAVLACQLDTSGKREA